jgi:hypothetical protein
MDEMAGNRPIETTVRALFCTDIDGTITKPNMQVAILRYLGFSHIPLEEIPTNLDAILACWDKREEEVWENVIRKKISLIGTAELWRNVFHTIFEEGHFHALVSFNIFGEKLIPRLLKEMIGLDEEFLNKLFTDKQLVVISHWPNSSDPFDKSKHMGEAADYFMPQIFSAREIILTDDDSNNYRRASENGHIHSIEATSWGSHLQAMIKLSKSIKAPRVAGKENKDERKYLSSSSESKSTGSLGRSKEGIFASDGTPNGSPNISKRSQSVSPSPTDEQRSILRKSYDNIKKLM